MLKRTVKYKDFNDQEVEEVVYFNLTRSELFDLALKDDGGFARYLERVSKSDSPGQLFTEIKNIILLGYGEKSEDGKRFIKTRDGQRLSDEFVQTAAYDQLFSEFTENATEFANFVKAMLPSDLLQQLEQDMLKAQQPRPASAVSAELPPPTAVDL